MIHWFTTTGYRIYHGMTFGEDAWFLRGLLLPVALHTEDLDETDKNVDHVKLETD